jgi:carboxymethylenebutenolidase
MDDELRQQAIALYDRFTHEGMERRDFFAAMTRIAGGAAAANLLIGSIAASPAAATIVPANDPRLIARKGRLDSNSGLTGYSVAPKGLKKGGLVLVIHENRGLNPYIEDVARRLAVANFIAFAPDALTTLGGYPGDEDKAREMFAKLDRGKMFEDFVASAAWLKARPDGTGKLGAVGFCFGGGVVNQLAVRMGSDLSAGVPFYGMVPSPADAAKIKTPINAQYGELDKRITDGWPAFDSALTEAGVPHEGHIYKGANHGFHNDTTPRYDEAAAKEAWQHTLDWFNKYLR